jgi:protein arginine N-methyltransferase 2
MAAIATTESSQAALNAELMAAAASGSAEGVRAALGRGAEAFHQEDARGTSALMAAAGAGSLEGVEALLAEGAPWNALDRFAKCAGDYALRGGHQDVVNALVEAGVRAELIFGQLEETSKALQAEAARENAAYISRDVRYEGAAANLLDGDKGVMMEWEAPLMETHAEILCQGSRRGGSVGSDTAMDDGEGAGGVGGGGAMCGDILNVGFGMGIIDSAIQQRRPRTHTIIEAHPNVYARMLAQGWDKRPGVIIKFGRWQDVVHGLIAEGRKFDGIMFDT